MARIVNVKDNEIGDVVSLYTIDAKAWIRSDPKRYEPADSETREMLTRRPVAVTMEEVMSGVAVDVTKDPKKKVEEEEARRAPKPGSRAEGGDVSERENSEGGDAPKPERPSRRKKGGE